jgi:hypothetical protein
VPPRTGATQIDQYQNKANARESPTPEKRHTNTVTNKNKKTKASIQGGTLFAANTPSGESARASISNHVYGADIQRRIVRNPFARSAPQQTCTTRATHIYPAARTMSRKSSTNQRRFFSYDA